MALPDHGIPELRRDDRDGVGEAGRRGPRLRLDRDSQPRALRPGDEVPRGGDPGVLREAADGDDRGVGHAGEGGRGEEGPLRRGTHLSRPLDQPLLALHRAEWTDRRRALGRRLVPAGLARRPHRGPGRDTGGMAGRSQAGWRELLRRRHRHARADAAALRHRPGGDAAQREPGDLRRRAAARRPLHHLLPALQRRPRAGARLADRHRPQERPRHRGQRHQGVALLVAGSAGRGDHPLARPARSDLLPGLGRGERRLPGRAPRGADGRTEHPPGTPRGVPRRVRPVAPLLRGGRPRLPGRKALPERRRPLCNGRGRPRGDRLRRQGGREQRQGRRLGRGVRLRTATGAKGSGPEPTPGEVRRPARRPPGAASSPGNRHCGDRGSRRCSR